MGIRITGNRQLQTLPGLATRPTPARVREAVFNILRGHVSGSRWLDLCSGAGTLGAEALCRGASTVIGIEQSRVACRIITANWQKVAAPEQHWQVIQGDARRLLAKGLGQDPFDLIYFDPPYESDLYDLLIPQLSTLLHPTGILIVEHRQTKVLPEQIGSFIQSDHREYGQTHLTFFQPIFQPIDRDRERGKDP